MNNNKRNYYHYRSSQRGRRQNYLSYNSNTKQSISQPQQSEVPGPITSFLTLLPHELLLHIFSFLDIVSLFRTRLVCENFRLVTSDPSLWRVLFGTLHKNNHVIISQEISPNWEYECFKEGICQRILQTRGNPRLIRAYGVPCTILLGLGAAWYLHEMKLIRDMTWHLYIDRKPYSVHQGSITYFPQSVCIFLNQFTAQPILKLDERGFDKTAHLELCEQSHSISRKKQGRRIPINEQNEEIIVSNRTLTQHWLLIDHDEQNDVDLWENSQHEIVIGIYSEPKSNNVNALLCFNVHSLSIISDLGVYKPSIMVKSKFYTVSIQVHDFTKVLVDISFDNVGVMPTERLSLLSPSQANKTVTFKGKPQLTYKNDTITGVFCNSIIVDCVCFENYIFNRKSHIREDAPSLAKLPLFRGKVLWNFSRLASFEHELNENGTFNYKSVIQNEKCELYLHFKYDPVSDLSTLMNVDVLRKHLAWK